LRGPAQGTVELPLWLYWSGPSPAFDLGEPLMRRWLYEIVLREAGCPEDLTSYLDAGTLIAVWPELYLPRGVFIAGGALLGTHQRHGHRRGRPVSRSMSSAERELSARSSPRWPGCSTDSPS
jgi:hypothetical protein